MPLFSKVRDIFKSGTSVRRKKVYHNVLLQNPDEIWSIKGEIGDGAYGKVYKAENISNGTLAALKKVALEEEDDLDNFMVEIDILAECQHPNIVQLLEAYHWEGCLWMYLEFCDGGAVDTIMVDLDRPLTEPQIAYLCKNLLEALDYIHKSKVIHRDLKAGNVLLTTNGGVKLADFGVSAKNKNTMDKRGTFIGTPYWLAPEVIKCETFIDSKYDYKADIWSLGITLIEFAQMDPPNHEVSPLRVLLKIQKAEPPKLDCPSKFSKEFNDFIAQCLIKEPEDRPDARALLRHPFVNKDHSAKHIIALLIEYQADVVEEDVEDDRDHRSSRLSIDSEDQSSASQDISVASDDVSIRKNKEVTPTGVMDRRATKGPAPPPPGQLKKGPAPSAPAPAKAVPTVTTAGALPQTTVVPAVATAASTTATTTPSVASSPVTTPTLPANSSKLPSLVTSTPIKLDNSEQSAAVAATVAAAAAATTVTAATATVTIAASTAAPLTTTTTTPITNDDDDADVVIVTASSRVNSVSTDDAIVSVGDSVTDSVSYITATTTVVSSVVSVSNVADNVTTTAAATSSLPSSVVTTCVPLTVVSPAVCVSTAAVQDIPSDGRKVSQDVSMVSITSLGEDYIAAPDLDSESSRILSEKLEVMEDDDDLVVSHQAMIVEPSSSKTLITSDNTNVADTTNNEVPMEVSATVLSIADSSNTEEINTVDISTNNSILTTKIASPTTPPDIVVSSPQITETPITFETLIPAELGDGDDDDDDDIMYDTFSASKRSADARQRAPDSPGVSTPDLPIELAATGDGVVVMTQEAVDAAASVSDSVVLVEDRTQDLALNVRREHDLPPAQIIASIGSEGTVILRTPTPTPSSPTPPSGTPTPSLVTFSGPGVVESSPLVPDSSSEQPPHSQDERDTAPVSFDYSLAEEEAVQLLDDVLDHVATTTSATASGNDSIISTDSTIASSDVAMVTAGADAATVAAASEVVVVSAGEGKKERAQQVVISNSSILEGESNTDDITSNRSSEQLAAAGGGADDAANISVVSVAETEKLRNSIEAAGLLLPSDTKVIIEGTTLGDTDTDTDNFVTSKDGVVSLSSEESDQTQAQQQQYYIDSRENMHILKPVLPEDSRSDSDSVSTVSSEKENSKPRGRSSTSGGEEEVQLRRPARLNSTDTSASTLNRSVNSINVTSNSIASTDGSLKPIDKNRQNRQGNLMRNGRTKEENDSLALRKKTRKRTRKFMIDGVIVTTTTSKVIYGDDEDGSMITSGHLARKQELRELKILQKLEQKQFQELGIKSTQARQEQDRKFDTEKTQLIRSYDNDVDTLNRQQKQQVERIEAQHEIELKSVSKKIRGEQEKDLRLFRESLKTELKLLKQEVDLLPKDVRKEALRTKKDRLEAEQAAKEKEFLERLHQNHESSMKRLSEEHRSHVALLERQFLQKKHQMLRAREAALWELEERHLHDRHQLAKRQLKDIFFLQRHQMLLRHEKELEQVRRQNTHREEELVKRQVVERRSMPKRIRQEMKARELMFRESMRISCTNLPDTHQDEKDKIRKFQECERRRYEAEKKRGEQKHKRQLEELVAATDAHAKELEQMQNEKRKMLMEHETVKLKAQEEEYQRELKEWKNNLKPRKQKLEDEFEHQLQDQEQFYGAYLTTCGGTMLAPALPDPQH